MAEVLPGVRPFAAQPGLVQANAIAGRGVHRVAGALTLNGASADALATWCNVVASRDLTQFADELLFQATALLWVAIVHHVHKQPHLLVFVLAPSYLRAVGDPDLESEDAQRLTP